MRWVIGVLLLVAAGCSSSTVVDVEPVPADYTDWYRIDATGAVPGHGDTYRIIYANDVARTFGTIVGTPGDDAEYIYRYPQGSIIVKEIHERDGDQPGAIKYLGVMRMLDFDEVPDGAELARPSEKGSYGWLFTYLSDDINSDEEYRSSCWDECHVASPYAGAFYDYGE
jgi:Cytochrome P460